MTVCIGAICDSGKSAVVAADRMVTFGPPMMLQTEPSAFKKITPLPTGACVLLFAGAVSEGEHIVSHTLKAVAGLHEPTIADVAEAVKNAYSALKRARVEENILRPLLGVDYAGFQGLVAQSSSSQLLQQILGLIMQHNLQTDIMVAGTDTTGSHLFLVTHPGSTMPMDTTGFATIGSGGLHAAVRISLGNHTKVAALPDTLHSVYEAKKAAEVAPGVGILTDMAIISAGKVSMVSDSLFKTLDKMHKEKPTLSKQELTELGKACDEHTK